MENQKATFTIGEFGRRAGVTVRTLRFYEEFGLLIPTQQNSSGHRMYGLGELAKLQQIQSLKFIGYSLQEIYRKLSAEDDEDAFSQLKNSLPLQHQLLTEKRDELNRAIKAVEHVQLLIEEGKPITWTIVSSLLYQMAYEEDQQAWLKENFSDGVFDRFYYSLTKVERQQMNLEMLDLLATVKELVHQGASPSSPEAFDFVIKLTELATKNMKKEDLEMFAGQLEKAQAMESETLDFHLPSFFTAEEEAFIEEILKEMEALQNKKEDQ